MRAGGRDNRNNCAEPGPVQALFDGTVLPSWGCRVSIATGRGKRCRSSHVRNAPLATVGPKKAACRDGPILLQKSVDVGREP